MNPTTTTSQAFSKHRLLFFGVAILASLAAVTTASATTWNEYVYGGGDAGDLPGIAQVVMGSGPLTSISGTMESLTDKDMFKIFLTGGRTFSATTVGGTSIDTQLFLFDSSGMGVYANDDTASDGVLSTLPAGDLLTPLTASLYYLAISTYNNDPVSAAGFIFPSFPYTDVFGPTEAGGGLPISNWGGSAFASRAGEYTILLTGAEPVSSVPEPASLLLLGSGLAGLAAWARKRGSDTARC